MPGGRGNTKYCWHEEGHPDYHCWSELKLYLQHQSVLNTRMPSADLAVLVCNVLPRVFHDCPSCHFGGFIPPKSTSGTLWEFYYFTEKFQNSRHFSYQSVPSRKLPEKEIRRIKGMKLTKYIHYRFKRQIDILGMRATELQQLCRYWQI